MRRLARKYCPPCRPAWLETTLDDMPRLSLWPLPSSCSYVNMEVNRVPLKAFIDSGAQSTIMGRSCAERCGLLRLLDTRFAGMAVGVGSAKILGGCLRAIAC